MPSSSPFNVVRNLTEGKSLELEGLFGSSEQLFKQTAATLFGGLKYKSTGEAVALDSSFRLQDVVFTHSGSEYADSALKLSSNGTAYTVGFRFERENDAPIVKSGDRLIIQQGKYYKLDSRLLKISDSDSSPDSINISLAFPENGGYLVYVNGEFRGSQQFTYREMMDNKVALYVQDLSKAGNINVQVDDGHDFGRGAIRVFHSEFATSKNILPTIAAGTKQPIKFIKGGSTLITLSDESKIGSNWFKSNDNGALAVDLKVKVLMTAVKSGYFTVDGKKTMDFTYQEIKDGLVQFIHDGTAKKPSFQFKLVDAMGATSNLFSSVSAIGEQSFSTYVDKGVTKDNHAPEFSGSSYFTLTPSTKNITISDGLTGLTVRDKEQSADDIKLSVFSNSLVGGTLVISGKEISYTAVTQDFVGGDVIKILADDSHGGRTMQTINISYTGGVPKVTANDFLMIDGINITLTTDMINGVDTGSDATPANQLVINIAEKTSNITFFKNGLVFDGSFTLQEVIDNAISITYTKDNQDPAFSFKITDQDNFSTSVISANLRLGDNLASSAPSLSVKALDPNQDTNSLVFDETYISVTDSDSADTDVTLSITNNNAGSFKLNGQTVSSFTWAEAKAGKVIYHGNAEPADHFITVTATDKQGNASAVDAGVYHLNSNLQLGQTGEKMNWAVNPISYYFVKTNEIPPTYPSPFGLDLQNVVGFSELEQANSRILFDTISSFTNLKFIEVNSYAASNVAFGKCEQGMSIYGQVADFPELNDVSTGDYHGDVWLNSNLAFWPQVSDSPIVMPGPKNSAWSTLIHELGHGLGLSHPYDGNGGNENSHLGFSTMSYNFPETVGAPEYLHAETESYMMGDVLTLQALYGVNSSASAGSNIYFLEDYVGSLKNVWDAGGTDLLDFSTPEYNLKIDLRDGHFSSLGADGLLNFSISYNTVIENLITGGGGDTIQGNGVGNNINSGKGDDTIYGNGGDDVINAGAGKDLIITEGRFGSVDGGAGTDTLRLGEGRINLTGASISNVEVLDLVNNKAQMISLNPDQLFSFTQIDGDSSDLIDTSAFRLVGSEGAYSIYQWLTNLGDTVKIDSDIVVV